MKRHLPRDRPPPLQISRPSDPGRQPFRPGGRRQPVIIYTYSPEAIATDPANFPHLVQRLTGLGSHTPPPPKRARFGAPAIIPNPYFGVPQGAPPYPPHQQIVPFRQTVLSPRGLRPPPAYSPRPADASALPHNPLLSPSLFDFSPSVLPSPSAFSFDLPSLASPMGTRRALPSPLQVPSGAVPGPSPRGALMTPRSLAAALPSPGPLSTAFLADLLDLSPAASRWIDRNPWPAELGPASRSGLPPRPPLTAIANLFPLTPPAIAGHLLFEEDEKPFLPYRDKHHR